MERNIKKLSKNDGIFFLSSLRIEPKYSAISSLDQFTYEGVRYILNQRLLWQRERDVCLCPILHQLVEIRI